MIFETEISSIGLPRRSNQFCTSYRIRILWYVHQGSGGYSFIITILYHHGYDLEWYWSF